MSDQKKDKDIITFTRLISGSLSAIIAGVTQLN